MEQKGSIPWEKVQKIQEALKPLGYVLDGYREKKGRRIILYLSFSLQFISIDEFKIVSPDVPGGAALDES